METEVAGLIGADRHERTPERTGHRNGNRMRTWDTRVGTIELAIPKVRLGTYFHSLLQPRRRAEHALLAVVQEAYLHDVSTRKPCIELFDVADFVLVVASDTRETLPEDSGWAARLQWAPHCRIAPIRSLPAAAMICQRPSWRSLSELGPGVLHLAGHTERTWHCSPPKQPLRWHGPRDRKMPRQAREESGNRHQAVRS
jgi:hypothetical protein